MDDEDALILKNCFGGDKEAFARFKADKAEADQQWQQFRDKVWNPLTDSIEWLSGGA